MKSFLICLALLSCIHAAVRTGIPSEGPGLVELALSGEDLYDNSGDTLETSSLMNSSPSTYGTDNLPCEVHARPTIPQRMLKTIKSGEAGMNIHRLMIYLLACTSGLRFQNTAAQLALRNGPCCGTNGVSLLDSQAALLFFMEAFAILIGPQWGSKAQVLSAGLFIPQVIVTFAMLIDLFQFANTENFVIFLQSAPYLFSATPHLLFLVFIVSSMYNCLSECAEKKNN